MLTLRDALTRATGQLSAHPELQPTALADAAVLLMHSLGIARPTLIAHPERKIDREQQARYQRLIERRLTFEPIQYILGTQEFYGLTLHVTPAVLIPRPETELLVEAVLQHLQKTNPHLLPSTRPGEPPPTGSSLTPPTPAPRVVDVGTGSGAIAIALAHALPECAIIALDLSADALLLAQLNATKHHVQHRIQFIQSDLLTALSGQQPYDVIVSNPPYIPDFEASTLHPQVRDHEPPQALFAGPTGLEIYGRLIPQAEKLLQTNGLLALEIGHGQQAALSNLLQHWNQVTFLPDLQGIPRVCLARTN